jgi:hypothetical protein
VGFAFQDLIEGYLIQQAAIVDASFIFTTTDLEPMFKPPEGYKLNDAST